MRRIDKVPRFVFSNNIFSVLSNFLKFIIFSILKVGFFQTYISILQFFYQDINMKRFFIDLPKILIQDLTKIIENYINEVSKLYDFYIPNNHII